MRFGRGPAPPAIEGASHFFGITSGELKVNVTADSGQRRAHGGLVLIQELICTDD